MPGQAGELVGSVLPVNPGSQLLNYKLWPMKGCREETVDGLM